MWKKHIDPRTAPNLVARGAKRHPLSSSAHRLWICTYWRFWHLQKNSKSGRWEAGRLLSRCVGVWECTIEGKTLYSLFPWEMQALTAVNVMSSRTKGNEKGEWSLRDLSRCSQMNTGTHSAGPLGPCPLLGAPDRAIEVAIAVVIAKPQIAWFLLRAVDKCTDFCQCLSGTS